MWQPDKHVMTDTGQLTFTTMGGETVTVKQLRGKEVQIWKATWVGRESASYNAAPSKVCLLGV